MYDHTMLSEAVESKGLTNKSVANMMGISESTVSRYLTGEIKEANAEYLCKFCDILDLSMDAVLSREIAVDLPTIENIQGKSLAEILLIVRDFVRRNYERLRSIEHEKDAAFNRHIDHLTAQLEEHNNASSRHIDHITKQLDKYSAQFKKYNIAVFSLIGLSMLLIGIMVMMFVNNRALQGEVEELEQTVARYAPYVPDDIADFPQE